MSVHLCVCVCVEKSSAHFKFGHFILKRVKKAMHKTSIIQVKGDHIDCLLAYTFVDRCFSCHNCKP